MTDESLEARMKRLRERTDNLVLPVGLTQRLFDKAIAQRQRVSWFHALTAAGRRALVFAALGAVVAVALAYSSDRGLEETITWMRLMEEP